MIEGEHHKFDIAGILINISPTPLYSPPRSLQFAMLFQVYVICGFLAIRKSSVGFSGFNITSDYLLSYVGQIICRNCGVFQEKAYKKKDSKCAYQANFYQSLFFTYSLLFFISLFIHIKVLLHFLIKYFSSTRFCIFSFMLFHLQVLFLQVRTCTFLRPHRELIKKSFFQSSV